MSESQRRFVSWSTDVLIYVVVLNLFDEFSDAIVIDSFWISLLTAVALKILLDVVLFVEHRNSAFWDRFEGAVGTWLGFIATVVVLTAGKFFILYAIGSIFGDEVHLGHLVSVTVLIAGLLLGETVIHWLYRALGPDELEATVRYPHGA